jgi:hypothetical protein
MLKKARSNADNLYFGEIFPAAVQNPSTKIPDHRGRDPLTISRNARAPRRIFMTAAFMQSSVKSIKTLERGRVLRSMPGPPDGMTSLQVNAVTVNSLPPTEMGTVTAFQPGFP